VLLTSQSGDLTLSAGKTLKAFDVELVADGGSVTVNGVIDASGTANAADPAHAAGGSIELWGAKGVSLTGTLMAESTASDELGGTVEIGTDATFTTGDYNPTYGYEAFAPSDSGVITIALGALINVSGGSVDGVSGGAVLIRAPLLYDGTVADDGKVNVTLAPNAFQGARSVSVEAYAVWSTADATTGAQHFDGVVDPAGWYDSNGNLLAGTFTNAAGSVVATWNGSTSPNLTQAQLAADLAQFYFTPTAADTDPTRTAHETFYGYVNGDSTAAAPGTLMGFVETPGFQTVAGSGGIANFQETPGIELDNPASANVNGGAISVLSSWNLGAENAPGNPVFRYHGAAPVLTVRAGGDIAVKASITDGFVEGG